MNKLLFFARDPGGANCIIPVINKTSEVDEIKVFAKDVAFDKIKGLGIDVTNIEESYDSQNENSLDKMIVDFEPKVIVTGTSVDDYTERLLWRVARKNGIPSIAIIDQWTNLGIRFSGYNYSQVDEYHRNPTHEYLPSYICVMDDFARDMMISEGVAKDRIVVTGQPHFDTVLSDYNRIRVKKDVNNRLITFVSEPIFRDYDDYGRINYWGFNEFSIFREMVGSIMEMPEAEQKDITIIIRPHPREDVSWWEKLLGDIGDIKIIIDSESNTYELLKISDLVLGMSSMMLLEAAICGVPMMSVMIGLSRENPFVLNNIGICHTVTMKDELKERMQALLFGNSKDFIEFSYIKNATDNVIRVIKEAIVNGKTSY